MDFTKKEEELLKLILKKINIKNSELATKLNISEEDARKIRSKVGKKLKDDLRRKVERHYR